MDKPTTRHNVLLDKWEAEAHGILKTGRTKEAALYALKDELKWKGIKVSTHNYELEMQLDFLAKEMESMNYRLRKVKDATKTSDQILKFDDLRRALEQVVYACTKLEDSCKEDDDEE